MFGKRKRPRIITGLDIGTTKICAIIGQADEDGNLKILGMGSCPSKGLQRGEVIEMQPTIDAIVQATSQATEIAGVGIDELYVGIAGEHLTSQNTNAMIEIRHRSRGIDHKDCRRAIQKAIDVAIPDDKALIHYIVQEFRVNGRSGIRKPIKLSGSHLEAHTHLVLACVDALNNILKCVRHAGFRNVQVLPQSLASSMSVIMPTEQQLGVLMVDIGGGTTDVAISADGAVRETWEIPMGGDRITRDIAELLSCSLHDAENVKKRHGCAKPESIERGRSFKLPTAGDPTRPLEHEEYYLAQIIEARLEDIFQMTMQCLEKSNWKDRLHAGVVLTGGTALLPGITDLAERVMEIKCRLGSPRGLKGFSTVVNSPIYATGVGLVLFGMEPPLDNSQPQGRLRRMMDYIIETFFM